MSRDMKKLFAEKLIKLRQERKLTQEELALLCGELIELILNTLKD